MKLFIVASMMGEGPVYVFSNISAANQFIKAEQGMFVQGASHVAGDPSKVFVVFFGDRGCTCGVAGIFADEPPALKMAETMGKDDTEGYAYWVLGEDVLAALPSK